MSIYYDWKNGVCKSYEEEVLKEGLAVIYKKSNVAYKLKKFENPTKLKANINKTKDLNLVLLNKNTGKYHKPTCKSVKEAKDLELIKRPKYKYKAANCCFSIPLKTEKQITLVTPLKYTF